MTEANFADGDTLTEDTLPEAAIVDDTATVGTGSVTTITTFEEVLDPNGWLSSGELRAPTDGVYLVTLQVQWSSISTSARILAWIVRNGTNTIGDDRQAGSSTPKQTVTALMEFEAGDIIRARLFQDGGASETPYVYLAAARITP
jgi:hypothetical protein